MNNAQHITWSEALSGYATEFLAARNLARRTREEYLKDLREVASYVAEQLHIEDVRLVERRHLESFLAELDRRELKGSSRRRKVSSIRSLFSYLFASELIASDPSQKLVPPARERPERRVLTQDEYQRLQLACSHDVRDGAIIELILQAGPRLCEVAAARLHDLELPARISKEGPPGAIHIHGKGRKERTVTLNYKAAKALKSWLAIRPAIADDHLFVSKFKEPLGPRSIEDVVTKHLHEAGIANASTHSLRHTFATHSAKRGTKVGVLQRALGHESLDTTSIYVDLGRDQMDKELQENAL